MTLVTMIDKKASIDAGLLELREIGNDINRYGNMIDDVQFIARGGAYVRISDYLYKDDAYRVTKVNGDVISITTIDG